MTRTAKLAMAGAFIATTLFSAGTQAASIQVFSDYGPKLTFDHNTSNDAQTAFGPDFPSGFSSFLATPFTLTNAITLDHIDVAISDASCGSSLAKGYIVDVIGDNGGKPEGKLYAHWFETKALSACGTVKATKLAVKPTVTVSLPGNATYWVVLTPAGNDADLEWYAGLTSKTGIGITSFSQDGGYTYNTVPAGLATALDVWRR